MSLTVCGRTSERDSRLKLHHPPGEPGRGKAKIAVGRRRCTGTADIGAIGIKPKGRQIFLIEDIEEVGAKFQVGGFPQGGGRPGAWYFSRSSSPCRSAAAVTIVGSKRRILAGAVEDLFWQAVVKDPESPSYYHPGPENPGTRGKSKARAKVVPVRIVELAIVIDHPGLPVRKPLTVSTSMECSVGQFDAMM